MRPYQPVHNALDEVKTITPGLMDQIFDTRTKGRLKDSICKVSDGLYHWNKNYSLLNPKSAAP